MKNLLFILALTISFFACNDAPTSTEDVRIPKQYTMAQFLDNTSVNGGSFSPDGEKLLVSTNETGIFNAAALAIDGSGMAALTESDLESIFAISYLPDDERFLYSADQGGNELTHIYMQDLDGEVTDLTPGEQEKANFGGWAKDLKAFYYVSNARDPNFFDLKKMNLTDFSSELIYENSDGYSIGTLSNNERYLTLTKSITTSSNEMLLLDRQTGEMKTLSEGQDNAYSPQFFDLNDQSFYYLANEGSEFQYVVKYDMESGETAKVFETNWDVWYCYESWNGKYRVIGINEDAKTSVKVFDAKTNEELSFPEIENRSISGISISRDETQMRMTAASSRQPSDIYLYNFETKKR